ncbi:MAG: hypothetical protein FD174_2620 [Geobacteraceae bacterium]|nr:MAG: hypothetical protein FD174_2620 [Geobacteraceae bacterium]
MLIVVQYTDETYDMVIDYHLDELIHEGKIAGFSSASGWVKVESAPVNRETGACSRVARLDDRTPDS